MQRLLLLTLVMSLLTNCAEGNSDPACVCPPIKEYDKTYQMQLAAEIMGAAQDAVFPNALQDYALLREQVRKCSP